MIPLFISCFGLKLGLNINPLISLIIILTLHPKSSDIFSKLNCSCFSKNIKVKYYGNVDILIFCSFKYKY